MSIRLAVAKDKLTAIKKQLGAEVKKREVAQQAAETAVKKVEAQCELRVSEMRELRVSKMRELRASLIAAEGDSSGRGGGTRRCRRGGFGSGLKRGRGLPVNWLPGMRVRKGANHLLPVSAGSLSTSYQMSRPATWFRSR